MMSTHFEAVHAGSDRGHSACAIRAEDKGKVRALAGMLADPCLPNADTSSVHGDEQFSGLATGNR